MPPNHARSSRMVGVTLSALIAALGGGCQTYEARPLALPEHRAAFLARTPESPEVRVFAERLAAGPSGADGPGAAGFDPADGVTCPEAELLAMVFNAELRLARLRAGVTRASAEHAGLWEDPTIGVDLTRVLDSTPEPWKVFTSVGLTIPISGRLEVEKRRASVQHAAELARIAQREWAVRMAVRRAWTDWSALDAQRAAMQDFLTRADQVLAVVDKMERAGEMTRTEARLFRIERATRAAEFATLNGRAREADLSLRQLMGMSPDAPLRLVAAGIGPGPSGDEMGAPANLGRESLELRSPALLVSAAEYEVAEKSLELEIRRQYPDLQIGPGYGREDGQDQLLLGLSLPIPIVNGNRRGIAEAHAQREVARAAAEVALEHLVSALRSAEARLLAAGERRRSLESEIVPLVDDQYADARRLASLGEVNTLVLLESLTRQQQAKLSLIEARREEAIARIDLDELIGPAVAPDAAEVIGTSPPGTGVPEPRSDAP